MSSAVENRPEPPLSQDDLAKKAQEAYSILYGQAILWHPKRTPNPDEIYDRIEKMQPGSKAALGLEKK